MDYLCVYPILLTCAGLLVGYAAWNAALGFYAEWHFRRRKNGPK